jgi:hypothetical protein
MTGTLRLALAAGAVAALSFAPAALRAQSAPSAASAAADSLAYPRQFVKWVFSSQGDSAYAHAGPMLREAMKSPEGVNEMAGRIATRFGAVQGTDAEIQFADGELKVYIAVMRLEKAPEPAAWIVAYSPTTRVVERSSFAPLSSVKTRYPDAKLP